MNIVVQSLLVAAVTCCVVRGAAIGESSNGDSGQVEVVDQYSIRRDEGFDWGYELSDGRYATQDGYIKELPNGSKVLIIKGSYSYVGPDGVKYTVEYVADETGYHPTITVGGESTTTPPVGFAPAFGEQGPSKPGYDQEIDPKVVASLLG